MLGDTRQENRKPVILLITTKYDTELKHQYSKNQGWQFPREIPAFPAQAGNTGKYWEILGNTGKYRKKYLEMYP